MISWNTYLLLCSFGIITAGLIIGYKNLFDLRKYSAPFLLIMYLTYVIRPYLSYRYEGGLKIFDSFIPGISRFISNYNLAIAIAFCIALISFSFGYKSIRFNKGQKNTYQHASHSQLYQINIASKRFSLLLIGLGYSSFFLARRGFIGFDTTSVEYILTNSGSISSNSTGYIELANYLVISGILLYYSSTGKILSSIVMALPWEINQIYYGYTRYMLIVLGVGIFAVWLAKKDKRRINWTEGILVAGIAVCSIILLILMRSNRMFISQGESFGSLIESVQRSSVDNAIGDFSGFEGTWYMISTLGYRTPMFGSNIIYNLFIKPIPRIIWSGKYLQREFTWIDLFTATDYSNQLYTQLGETEDLWYIGAVKGSIGYSLEEWGWAGLFINFFLTGLILAWMEFKFSTASIISPPWIAAYAATYGLIAMLGRNDIFSVLTNHILLFYLPYIFFNWWIKRYIFNPIDNSTSFFDVHENIVR